MRGIDEASDDGQAAAKEQGPLWQRSATDLAHLIATKQVPSREVIDAHPERTAAANVLGLPVVAMSNGVHNAMPVGVQISSSQWREDRCLDAAEAIERHCGVPGPIDPTWS